MDDLAPSFNVEEDLFAFETDHLALKGNGDYCEVLKTLVILAAQREQALTDYKTVAELKEQALQDPFETLEKMKNGVDIGVPPLMEVAKLPKIDFQKYKIKLPESDLKEIYLDGTNASTVDEKPNEKSMNPNFNRCWTPEEQKRLEELLQVYPPEPVEMRRFQKIAKALGNRTVQQVASRIQKYFLKLYKAGLPIPGRIPKAAERYKRNGLHKHQRHNHFLWKPTTFFPKLTVPVQMDDISDVPGPSEPLSLTSTSSTDNYLLQTGYQQDATNYSETTLDPYELQLNLLKRIRDLKQQEQSEDYLPFTHLGFKCDYCEESPITGTRWHCTSCPDSVDFCTDCVVSQMYSEGAHPLHHWLSAYRDDLDTDAPLIESTSTRYEKQIADEVRTREMGLHVEDEEEEEDEEESDEFIE